MDRETLMNQLNKEFWYKYKKGIIDKVVSHPPHGDIYTRIVKM